MQKVAQMQKIAYTCLMNNKQNTNTMTNATTQQLEEKLDKLQTQFENVQLEWCEFNRMTQLEKVQSEKRHIDFVSELAVIRALVDRALVTLKELK